MRSARYMHVFTLTDPWAELGLIRRVARICRIIFGCILSGSLLLMAAFCACSVRLSTSISQVLSCVIMVPFFVLLAWASGCMFIWRRVYPLWPPSGGLPPPEPNGDAPCPVPLCPVSPLIQSAAAEPGVERRPITVTSGLELDLRAAEAQPVQRFAALLLYLGVTDSAETLQISLHDIASESGTHLTATVGGVIQEYAPAPGSLYRSIVVVLCNHAGVPYYSKGRTEGTIIMRCPRSTWRLQSDDLDKSVLLSRILPTPKRKPFVKPNFEGAGFA